MKNYITNRLIYFSASFIVAFALFASIISVCLIPKNNAKSVAEQNLTESYYTSPAPVINKKYLVQITDLPLYFYISLNSFASQCTVFAIPKSSVKNSTITFDTNLPLESCEKFFSFSPDNIISINSSLLEQFINLSGGINMPTPYGITSPSVPQKYISSQEVSTIFGFTFLSIINDNIFPDREKMSYYSEVVCQALKSILSDFSKHDLDFLNDKLKLNISYIDYYNNRTVVENCFQELIYSAPEGVWINEKYFLK